MKETEQIEKYCCNYRGWEHYFMICIGVVFFSFAVFAAMRFHNCIIGGIAAVAFVYTGYLILETLNKRVFLEEDMIAVQNIWGNQKRYKISDISSLVICNHMHSTYVVVRVAEQKFKIRKSPNGYHEFVKELFRILKLTGYSRGGKQLIDIDKCGREE